MEKFIKIEQGEIDQIIGSPNYGKPTLKIQIEGYTPFEAQKILVSVQTTIYNKIETDFYNLQKRLTNSKTS